MPLSGRRLLFAARPGRLARAARAEPAAVIALAAVAICVWAFLSVADEVMEGETHAIDRALLLALRKPGDPSALIGPEWLHIYATDITGLGSIAILTFIVLVVAGLFVGVGKRAEALLLIACSAGGVAISQVLKSIFHRERPELSLHAVEVINTSFPSGHAMLSAAVFLTLGALAAEFTPKTRLKAFALGAGIAATLLVGVSRVYLGVHWPTDVLAGWCVGAAWASACWLGAWAWERRGGRAPKAERL
ncbi:MAG: phosphoesterase [Caulobacterales bacterium 68-7]|nr:phosphatase PAP2 family protein [Caulobacterales bacterium]OJU13135.1 MAG: phosphoesterase [Caulobacterales bacterium 68-7]